MVPEERISSKELCFVCRSFMTCLGTVHSKYYAEDFEKTIENDIFKSIIGLLFLK